MLAMVVAAVVVGVLVIVWLVVEIARVFVQAGRLVDGPVISQGEDWADEGRGPLQP